MGSPGNKTMNTTPAAVALRPPFRKEHQLNNELDGVVAGTTSLVLPSQRRLSMASSNELAYFLVADICPTKLNQLANHLWLCSASSYTNVPPLHIHAIHGRTIVPTEDPALHLVWVRGRISFKPLPAYLLSHTFWTQHLYHSSTHVTLKPVTQAALGLLRSYHLSIRHESDLRIAQQSHLNLVPHDITWKQWCDFSTSFDEIQNYEVAPRYHYGKFQLSRLHWLVRIFSRELHYYYIDGDYGESFKAYYGPLLFVFGILSVLLSAMQVGMAVEQLQSHDWWALWSVCRWFSVISLVILAVVSLFLLVAFLVKTLDEIMWAARAQYISRLERKNGIL